MSRRFIDEQDKYIYSIWKGMNKRCNNKNCKDYKWYGGKGIKVCEEWHDYLNFRKWAIENSFAIGVVYFYPTSIVEGWVDKLVNICHLDFVDAKLFCAGVKCVVISNIV